MTGFVYLIRNQDLYKIGITQNLNQRMSQLKPDEIIAVLETQNFEQLEKDLHQRYSDVRIPQSEYFRLTDSQLENCINTLQGKVDFGFTIESETTFQPAILAPFIFFFLTILFGFIFDLISDIDEFSIYKNSAKFTATIFSVLSPLVIVSIIFKIFLDSFQRKIKGKSMKDWGFSFGLYFLVYRSLLLLFFR